MDREGLTEDGLEAATRLAEQAMARMARERVAPTPENFAVWYAHYSGRAPDLSRAIEILASSGQAFSTQRSADLYDRFVGGRRETEAVRAAGLSIQTMLDELLSQLEAFDSGTSRYGAVLETARGRLDPGGGSVGGAAMGPGGVDQLRQLLALVAGETRRMVDQNQSLQSQLSSSNEQLSELRRNLDNVRREAVTDALTGLFNRKHFDGELRRLATEAMEVGAPVSLLMIDIDHFKRFNDTWGHTVGDTVLALVARTIRDCIRDTEMAARYGGEEFAVIAPGTDLAMAVRMGERIRDAVSKKQVVNRSRNQSLGSITLSVGIAEYRPGEPLAALVQRADEALYAAKRQGRDQVVSAAQPTAL
ncbi:GGDEF domain-containing protein [Arenibaculum pallidiluteum]|uniref:GGDEF domain-containing protein n=1 Tax=Arenibaculum pallidiluteum TaxID=2812559 RepID=UPI001A958C31|nr:GGDEF domain-containing protein [Arenibaculum pallidiluteum]